MRWPASLRPLRVLATRSSLRRGFLVGALAFCERLLTPAAAWALFARPLGWKLTMAFFLAATFTLRSFAQRLIAARTEGELMVRVTAAVLEGDVLCASVLPEEDARAELFQGVYHASQQLAQDVPVLAADLAAAVILAAIVSVLEPARIVGVAVALALLAGGTLAWSRHRLQRENARAWKLQDQVVGRLVDALEGRLELVASGRRTGFVSETGERARAWGSASARVAASTVLSGRLPLLAIAAVVAMVVGFGSCRANSLPVSIADIALFASVTPAFAGVAQGLQAMVRAERWVAVVTGVIERGRPVDEGGKPPPQLPRRIAFEHVSFRYEGAPKDTPALRNVCCTWEAEPVLALSGANGSGKSTCLRLLLALGRPSEGRVLIDDTDLADVDADAWRECIAFLPQRPYLPPRSDIRSAIHLLAPQASDESMRRALDRVGLLAGLRRLGPELEVRVDTLSVGQRQRIALARLLCRDASIFILDEPDANLDRAGIALVVNLVAELVLAGCRVILAAHTPELLAAANRIVVLEDGQTAREGDHRAGLSA